MIASADIKVPIDDCFNRRILINSAFLLCFKESRTRSQNSTKVLIVLEFVIIYVVFYCETRRYF